MKFRISALVLALAAFAGAGHSQASIIAQSTFTSNAQGWIGVDLQYPAYAPLTIMGTHSLTWSATGGNPGGHVRIQDPSGNVIYFSAPASFLGNQSAAYGGSLSFDIAVTTPPGFGYIPAPIPPDVILVGPSGLVLVRDIPFSPASSTTVVWHSFTVNLDETNWRVGSLTGPFATQAQMQTVLGSLSAIYILAEAFVSVDTGYLDNVILRRPEVVPEPMSLILFLAGSKAYLLFCYARKRMGAGRPTIV